MMFKLCTCSFSRDPIFTLDSGTLMMFEYKCFLAEIRSNVNDMEHFKIKNKFEKRLAFVKELNAKVSLVKLVERLNAMTEKVALKPLEVFEIIKSIFDEFESYRTLPKSRYC